MPVECAVSDRNGHLTKHYEGEHAVAAGSRESDRTIEVTMETGDELCRKNGFEPDVIKIDVEGHEMKVFRGLTQTIRRHKPTIFLEVHPSTIAEEGDRMEVLAESIGQCGYRVRTVSGEPFSLSRLATLKHDERLMLS